MCPPIGMTQSIVIPSSSISHCCPRRPYRSSCSVREERLILTDSLKGAVMVIRDSQSWLDLWQYLVAGLLCILADQEAERVGRKQRSWDRSTAGLQP